MASRTTIGLCLIALSPALALLGPVIPILGMLIAYFAPDVLLIGVLLVSVSLFRKLPWPSYASELSAVVFTLLFAINTRAPSIVLDAFSKEELWIGGALNGMVGMPLHIHKNTDELWVRRDYGASVAPSCYGDGCLATKGFSGPYSKVERDYWRENIDATILAAGFSKARPDESAPLLRVSQIKDDDLLTLKLELLDEVGDLRALFKRTYRNGYSLETQDAEYSDNHSVSLSWGIFQYLLHGNFVVKFLSSFMSQAVGNPVKNFLLAAVPLSGHPYREVGNATKVRIEILKETRYDPVQSVRLDAAFDNRRVEHCKLMLKQEAPGNPTDGAWYLFLRDPTGRKKVRYSYGNFLCDDDEIWSLEYGVQPNKIIITKFSPSGDLVFRIIFDEPDPIYGFDGYIAMATLREQSGAILFEWWNTARPASIIRLIEASISIPKLQVH